MAAALFLALVTIARAADEDTPPDRRAVTAPAVSSAAARTPAARESLVDLLLQVDALQVELRELRNTVDIQGHELAQLRSRQRDLLEDLDRRVRALEARQVRVEPPPPAIPGAEAPPAVLAAPPDQSASQPSVPAPVIATAPPAQLRSASPEEQKEYDAAFALMKQGQYDKAINAFHEFVARHPDVALSGNAQYWAAEGNYVRRRYKQAIEEFGRVLQQYPGSPKVSDALLKIGYSHYELGEYPKARVALSDLVARFPGTDGARLAQARLDKMKSEGH